jgi:hypothetical protein
MAGMKKPISGGKAQLPLTMLILFESGVIALRSLHIISTGWTLILFFVVIIPFATLKAFAEFRQS